MKTSLSRISAALLAACLCVPPAAGQTDPPATKINCGYSNDYGDGRDSPLIHKPDCPPVTSAGTNKFSVNSSSVTRTMTDLQLFGGGSWEPLSFRRTYRSRYEFGPSWFGQARHFTHSHQWTLQYMGELAMPGGGDAATYRLIEPSGLCHLFHDSGSYQTFQNVSHLVYKPSVGRGSRLLQNGDDFFLLRPGGAYWRFLRIWDDDTARYEIREHVDERGNSIAYENDSEGRLIRVTDPAGKSLYIHYRTVQAQDPVELHEITTTPPNGWVILTPSDTTTEFKCLQVASAEGGGMNIAEAEFWTEVPDGNGGWTEVMLTGTPYGTAPAHSAGTEYDKMFDGSTSTYFRFALSWYGFGGIELAQPARVTKICYRPRGGSFDRSVLKRSGPEEGATRGTLFQGLRASHSPVTVIDKVTDYDVTDTNATGREVVYEYENFTDPLLGVQYLVLKEVDYGDGAPAVYTYYQQFDGGRPLIRVADDPRYEGGATRIAYRYVPDALGPQGAIWQEWSDFDEGNGNYSGFLVGIDATSAQRKVTYADGREILHNFVSTWQGNQSWTEDGEGNRMNFTYQPDPVNPSRQTGFLLSKTDPMGNTTSYQRNAFGQATRIDHPDGAWEENDYDTSGRLLETRVGGSGITTRVTGHSYDSQGRLTQTAYPDGTSEQWQDFDDFGQAQRHIASNGCITDYEYDEDTGLLLSMTEASGQPGERTTTYTYYGPGDPGGNPEGLLESVTDPRSLTTTYEYNNRGQVVKATYPDSTVVTVAYDDYGNVAIVTDELGHETVTAWNQFRQRVSVTVAAGTAEERTTTYQYGLLGSGCSGCGAQSPGPTLTTLPSGKQIARIYDKALRLVSETHGYGTADAATSSYLYDKNGNLARVIDSTATVVAAHFYDSRDRPVVSVDALGHITVHQYDRAGNRVKTTRPDGSELTFSYDILDRLVSSTDAKSQTTGYVYNYPGDANTIALPSGTGHTVTLVDPRSNSRLFAYDLFGRLIEKRYPDNSTETYAYIDDAGAGQTGLVHTRPDGDAVSHDYDARGRNTLRTWDDGLTPATAIAYDDAGRLTSIVRGNRELHYTYDAANFLRTETSLPTGGSSQTVTYTYDADGNRASLEHPDSHLVEYAYTGRNQLAALSADGPPPLATYTWRSDGIRESLEIESRYRTDYHYDPAKRLTLIATADTVIPAPVTGHAYAHDLLSRRVSQLFGDGTHDLYGYDAADQVTAVHHDAQHIPGGTLNAYIDFGPAANPPAPGYRRDGGHAYGFRGDGYYYGWSADLTGLSRKRNSPDSPDERHDTLNHFDHPNSPNRYWEIAVPAGQYRVTVALGDPHYINSVYALNAEGVQVVAPFTPSWDQPYAYGTATVTVSDGRLTLTQGTGGDHTKICFLHIERVYALIPVESASFAYDAAGNRTSAAEAGQSAITYTSNSLDQYTYVGAAGQTHDDDGNLLSDGLRLYTWDSEGKLLSMQADAPAVDDLRLEHTYDPLGRRVERRTYKWNGTIWVHYETARYLYDGWNMIEEAIESPPGTPMAYRRYTWGLDLSGSLQGAGGVGGLLMAEELTGSGTLPYYYSYDGNGNVTAITDGTGATVASYRYTAFGTLRSATGAYASTNAWRFSTKMQDPDIAVSAGTGEGLYYYGYRYYDPNIGKWPSRDPIWEAGGMNLYRFVWNDGISYYDYLGLCHGCGIQGSGCIGGISNTPQGRQILKEIIDGIGGKAGQLAKERLAHFANINRALSCPRPRQALSRLISDEQRKLLSEFLGPGVKGAKSALGRGRPEGLTNQTLEIYREISKKCIEEGMDKIGTQAERLKVIEEILSR